MNPTITKKHYVYKITNIINGKIYIGKSSSEYPHRHTDYMGNGKLIMRAIQKYGVENFTKEVLNIFDTEEEAFKLEAELVDTAFIKRADVYNMKEGGFGGFGVINSVPVSERSNFKALRKGILEGTVKCGGTYHWTEESRQKVLYQSWGNRIARGEHNPNTWEGMSEEGRKLRASKIAEASMGSGNSQYGTHIYIRGDYPLSQKLPPTSELNKSRYKSGTQPNGWITVSEWRDRGKKKSNAAYGKHWYTDGTTNYFCKEGDDRIAELNLKKGRVVSSI